MAAGKRRRRRNPKPRNLGDALKRSTARMTELEIRRKKIDAAIRRYEREGGHFLIRGRLGHAKVRTEAALDREYQRRIDLLRAAEEKYDAERGHRPIKKNSRRRVRNPGELLPVLAKLAIGGVATWAAYHFLYVPWHVAELTRQQAAANVAKGMNLTDAANAAVAAGCVAGSAVFGAPPTVSAGICKGLAPIAVAGAKEAVKGAVIGAKLLGKETAKGAKIVASTAKKAVSAVSHGFGLWGLGDVDAPLTRSSGLGRTTPRRARQGRTNQAAAAANFYLRHL